MNLAVTNIINSYHVFDRDFWLNYKTLEKLHPDFESIKMNLLKSKYVDPSYYKDIANYIEERDALDQEWIAKNEESKTKGTLTHEYIQNLLCNNPQECKTEFLVPTDRCSLLDDLINCNSGIFVEKRLEIQLDPDYTLVGIPDCFIIENGVINIKDWKCLDEAPKFKSMYDLSKHQNKKLKFPLNGTDDVNGIHYQILLSIYMWMLLLLRPDLKPGIMEIVWIKNNKIKKVYPVDYLDAKVDKLLKWHVKSLKLQSEIDKCREIKY